jgi:hypothetical protein
MLTILQHGKKCVLKTGGDDRSLQNGQEGGHQHD